MIFSTYSFLYFLKLSNYHDLLLSLQVDFSSHLVNDRQLYLYDMILSLDYHVGTDKC